MKGVPIDEDDIVVWQIAQDKLILRYMAIIV